MSFRRKIKYLLVHHCKVSNKNADEWLKEGKVKINGHVIYQNEIIDPAHSIEVEGDLIKPARKYRYFLFYKPRGYISSMNLEVAENIAGFFNEPEGLSIAGRLDKDSEGLLLVTDDGKTIKHLTDPGSRKEKEYEVILDRVPGEDIIRGFQEGIILDGIRCRPAHCEIIGKFTLQVIITEGKYRQIRRICHRFNYNVISLKRMRIDRYYLGDVKEGCMKAI